MVWPVKAENQSRPSSVKLHHPLDREQINMSFLRMLVLRPPALVFAP